MRTPASPGYRDRVLLRVGCWLVRRLRARGPLPTPLLVAAGLVRIVDGDPYAETTPGVWSRLPGVADAPPPRRDAWCRSTYWEREPDAPPRTPWFRVP
jgi:hypothetical protein